MRKGYVLGGLLAAAMIAGAAPAAVLATSVSATGSYNGDLAVLNDGVVPANGSNYNSADKVSFTAAGEATFRFDFGGVATITSRLATVDNNDLYSFRFYNGDDYVLNAPILPGMGSVGFGVETFTQNFDLPFTATHVFVTANGGDNLYGIGEVQFSGALANGGVPEPATWAMMIGGFDLAGAAARRRRPAGNGATA